MAVYNDYTVELLNGTNVVTVGAVQSLSCFVGRQSSTDAWQPSRTTIRARYPQGHASPLAGLIADAPVVWYAPNETYPSWAGRITNVMVEYGVPWNGSTTGVEDYLTIDAEGALGIWGRGNITLPASPVQYLQDMLNANAQPSKSSIPNVGASLLNFTIDDPRPALDWLQRATASVQAVVQDGLSAVADSRSATVGVELQSQRSTCEVSFSDVTNDATHRVYSEIIFDGLADNFYTRITVNPENVAAQSVVVLGNDPPYRELNVETFNSGTSQAASIANGLAAQYGYPLIGLAQIQAKTSAQHTQNLHTLTAPVSPPPSTITQLGDLVGSLVQVDFRGDTYYAVLEGVGLSANLNESVFTYYLTPSEITGWFTLDSTAFGELDDDRLAYL